MSQASSQSQATGGSIGTDTGSNVLSIVMVVAVVGVLIFGGWFLFKRKN